MAAKAVKTKKSATTATPTTTPILKFTAPICDTLRERMRAALQTVEQQMGVTITVGRMNYGDNRIDAKVEVETSNVLEATFNRHFKMYDFKKEDLGRSFGQSGKQYTFLGLNSGKLDAVCSVDGEEWCFDADIISASLGNNPYAHPNYSSWMQFCGLSQDDINTKVTFGTKSYTILGVKGSGKRRKVVVRTANGEVGSMPVPNVLKALGRKPTAAAA